MLEKQTKRSRLPVWDAHVFSCELMENVGKEEITCVYLFWWAAELNSIRYVFLFIFFKFKKTFFLLTKQWKEFRRCSDKAAIKSDLVLCFSVLLWDVLILTQLIGLWRASLRMQLVAESGWQFCFTLRRDNRRRVRTVLAGVLVRFAKISFVPQRVGTYICVEIQE